MDVIQKGRDWFQQSIKGISNVYSLREGERIPLKKEKQMGDRNIMVRIIAKKKNCKKRFLIILI